MQSDLTKDDVNRALLVFVLPLAAGSLLQQLYNIVDTYVVGKYIGAGELAAIGSVTSLFFFFNAIILGLRTGIMVVCAKAYGQKYRELFFDSAVAGGIVISIVMIPCIVLGFCFTKELLCLISVPDEIINIAIEYMRIISLGLPFLFLFNLGNSVFQAMGNSRKPFVVLLISTITNVTLDLFLVCRLGLGVRGAAFATLFAQFFAALAMVFFTLGKLKSSSGLKIRIKFDCIVNILKISFPAVLQQGIISIGTISVSALVNRCGTVIIAATAIGGKIESIISPAVLSIAESLSVFTSQNLGARKDYRVWKGLKSGLSMCMVLTAATLIMTIIGGEDIIKLFLNEYDPLIVIEGKRYMFSSWAVIFLMSFGRCGTGVLAGYQKMKSVVVSYLVNISSRVVIAYLMFNKLGKFAVYIANPLSVFIGAIVTLIYIYIYFLKDKAYFKRIGGENEKNSNSKCLIRGNEIHT